MANLVKTKSYISVFSLAILSIVILYEKDFYREKKIKNWTLLTWEDFDGIPLPFTSYSAGIQSFVYIEYDSIIKAYKSYAGQNNVGSWVKSSAKHSEDLLRHEQYHFNITEYHSRVLNSKIEGLGKENEKEVTKLLRQTRKDLSKMQKDYDKETDHSRNVDIQRYWEFKIDSLLIGSSIDNNPSVHTDYLAGTRVFFPDTVSEIISGSEKDYVYKMNKFFKYGISFSITNIQQTVQTIYNLDKIQNLLLADSLQIDSLESIEFKRKTGVYSIVIDTFKNNKKIKFWLDNDFESVEAVVTIPHTKNNKGYEKIAYSILNSIEFFDCEEYWKNKFLSVDINKGKINKTEGVEPKNYKKGECFQIQENGKYLFYKPLLLDNGDLGLVYDIVGISDSLIIKNCVFNGNRIMYFPLDSGLQKIRIPKEFYSENDELFIGYFQKMDSTQECIPFINEYLMLN